MLNKMFKSVKMRKWAAHFSNAGLGGGAELLNLKHQGFLQSTIEDQKEKQQDEIGTRLKPTALFNLPEPATAKRTDKIVLLYMKRS